MNIRALDTADRRMGLRERQARRHETDGLRDPWTKGHVLKVTDFPRFLAPGGLDIRCVGAEALRQRPEQVDQFRRRVESPRQAVRSASCLPSLPPQLRQLPGEITTIESSETSNVALAPRGTSHRSIRAPVSWSTARDVPQTVPVDLGVSVGRSSPHGLCVAGRASSRRGMRTNRERSPSASADPRKASAVGGSLSPTRSAPPALSLLVQRIAIAPPPKPSPEPVLEEKLAQRALADAWVTSDEDTTDHGSDKEDTLDYRAYRYQRGQEVPRKPSSFGLALHRRVQAARVAQERPASCGTGCSSPWSCGSSSPVHGPLAARERCVTPRMPEERTDVMLLRVAQIVSQFYGLSEGVTCKNNAVTICGVAWAGRSQGAPTHDPPTFWLRGGRVYDFHGDRGTVAEFEDDLLIRGVEDDVVCRSRRKTQGLMPFPFVPLPLPQKDEEVL